MKVVFFGTHCQQMNGYSRITHNLAKQHEVFKNLGVDLLFFGFQKFNHNPAHRRDIPSSVDIFDAYEAEKQAGKVSQGFGFEHVRQYVNDKRPDVCVIFNDMMVIHNVVSQLKLAQTEDKLNFKIIAYVDQVYLNQKKVFIDYLNKNTDHVICFTEFWQQNIKDLGVVLPTDYLQHGFDPMNMFPVPQHLARKYFNLKEDDFIILNLNRNQPRKKWDFCLKAFAEIVSRYHNTNGKTIKMLVGTGLQGGWDLIELYERELKKRNMTLEQGMKHLIILDNPQMLTDEEVNFIYNVSNLGINTCDGEGFGLCNFEQAAIGIAPQVCPNLGGFKDFFDETNSFLCEPVMSYYVDNSRDAVCGEALLCDYMDFVEGIETYYNNPELAAKHAKAARERILKNYKWDEIAAKLANICLKVCPPQVVEDNEVAEIAEISDEIEKIDISAFTNLNQKKNDDDRRKELIELQKRLAELLKEEEESVQATVA
jgi:D-inositol-3-phosphate glycosyltransferase